MNFLGVDTTGKTAKIVLIAGEKKVVDKLADGEKQSENLMFHIEEILAENGLNIHNVDVFGAVVGPGSFTGIRVGVATIKAFAYALKKPLVSVNVFDVLGECVSDGVCLLNCTSTSLYYGVVVNKKIEKMGVIEESETEKFENFKCFCLEDEHLEERIAYKVNVITGYDELLLGAFNVKLACRDFSDKLEPLYIQLSQAERNLEKKND